VVVPLPGGVRGGFLRVEGRRQKAEGRRQKAEDKRTFINKYILI
jgi:hypothetical protein